MGLTRTAIARPVFVLMLMLSAIIMGWISYNSMRKELNPDVSFGVVTVVTSYPGAGPEEINNLISRPVESAVSGVNGIREITSTSREGLSLVVINFELGTDIDVALSDVRSKIDSVANGLPKDALKPTVSKNDTSSQPVLYIAVNSSVLSSRELRDLIDKQLIDKFGQISGVASADVLGGDVREIQVQVKRDKLMSYGLGINDVQRAIANANGNIPVGRIVTDTQEYSVRVPAQFTDAKQIRDLVFPVTSQTGNGPGVTRSVRLSDVADVTDAVVERTQYSRLNGKDNITIAIQKTRDGNAVEITQAADKVIEEIQKQYKDQGITFVKTLEAAKQITESLADLQFALIFGIILVAAIVYLFLHNFRGMLIVALAIPTCIFASFVAMKLFGFTINNMSMLSLSLAVGVLVDDAIVVIENIYRHLKAGEDPRDAAINGRSEIGLAAIAITLADVVVFMPIAFMGGIVGQFFKPLALGFVMATLFSLFVSFTLTPMLASRWYRRGEDMEHPTGRFARWFEHRFSNLENRYRRGLEWALKHRWFVFILGNLALPAVIVFIAASFMPKLGMALGFAQPLIVVAVVVGFSVFGFQFLKKAFADKSRSKIYLGLTAVVFVALLAAPMPLPLPVKLIFSFFVSLVLLGIVGFFANLGMRKVRSRIILNAFLFGLIFPAVAFVGFEFAQWKKEAVFKGSFLPTTDAPSIGINIELPPGSNLAQTQKVVSYVEDIAMRDREVKYVTSQVGSQAGGFGGGGTSGSNYAQITATLYERGAFLDKVKEFFGKLFHEPPGERLRWAGANTVSSRMLQEIGRVPGASIKVSSGDAVGFGSPIQLGLGSNDHTLLAATAKKIRDGLATGVIPGIINADISSKEGKPELQLIPDRRKMADANVSLADLAAALRTLYTGNNDAKLRSHGDEYDIRVMLNLNDRNDLSTIQKVPVVFKQGNPITVGDLTTLKPAIAFDKIERRNRLEEIRVTADLLPGYAPGTVQAQVDQWIKDNNLIPEGVTIRPLGQADAQAREQGYMGSAYLLGLLLVYMLLASLYDNLLYPFIIQIAQPQALTGALLALIITNKDFNLVGFIGVVTLTGLVGKNAILLVDYANTLRSRGRTRHDALVESGPTRLRPILMTTLALILGMLPVALAIGRGSEFRETIGIIIIGGMTLSTLLTLFVIPCSYTIFDDISLAIGDWMGRRNRGGDDDTPPASVSEYESPKSGGPGLPQPLGGE